MNLSYPPPLPVIVVYLQRESRGRAPQKAREPDAATTMDTLRQHESGLPAACHPGRNDRIVQRIGHPHAGWTINARPSGRTAVVRSRRTNPARPQAARRRPPVRGRSRRAYRTTSTGILECVRTFAVSLPRSRLESPLRPCEAMMIRSHFFFFAVSMIFW